MGISKGISGHHRRCHANDEIGCIGLVLGIFHLNQTIKGGEK